MNSEERPATGRDRLIADQQHTVPARPVKAHFECFSGFLAQAACPMDQTWTLGPLTDNGQRVPTNSEDVIP
jgi:hypothetical protein